MGADWLLPVYGLIVGMLVGLTGMGGGVLMTPLLVLGLGMPATAAIGTDLAYSSVTKLAGTWQHWRQGTVDMRVVRALAVGSVPATLVAVATLFFLHSVDATAVNAVLEWFFGVMLVVAAALMLQKLWRGKRGVGDVPAGHLVIFPTGRLVAIGAFGGFLVGLTSIGSGSLIIALLVITVSLTPDKLVGTDVAHAFLLVGVAALAHLFVLNDVDVVLAGKLLVGSIPGVLIGSRLTVWVPRRPLQAGLAVLLLTTAVSLLR
ncbi:MAG TPA: sulfite exporter TauE/SafE family protein [Thermomicrobiales bacterium]|nr:sulfite exporter TauE/SafE family protein [Thermomicrobiales bacterium]